MKPFNITHISGPLYLANKVWLERDLAVLQQHGIGAIVNLMEDHSYEVAPPLVCLNSGFPDEVHVPTEQLETIYSFIDRYRQRTNILIHCSAGVSRSAGILVGQLMRENPDWSWEQALSVVHACRSVWVAVEVRESVLAYLGNRTKPLPPSAIRDDDAQVLQQLSRTCGVRLQEVRRIGWDTRGFLIEDGCLVGLGLHNSHLACLPGIIRRLTGLRDLYLCENQLEVLPGWITELVHLRTINLSGNQLGSLPDEIGDLTDLRILNIAHNQLDTIPDAVQKLCRLEQLCLHDNQIACLPEGISQLGQIRELYLRNNRLVCLPEDLGGMTGLQELALSGNQIQGIPESIGNLSSLRLLTLAKNHLTQLPRSLSRLTALDNLNISSNRLVELPDSLAELNRLRRLNIAFNGLLTLSSGIERWIDHLRDRGCIVIR